MALEAVSSWTGHVILCAVVRGGCDDALVFQVAIEIASMRVIPMSEIPAKRVGWNLCDYAWSQCRVCSHQLLPGTSRP